MKKNIFNVVSLGGIQAANAIFPLLIFPWLLGRLGVERFSAVVITESLTLLAMVVIVYSFDVDGVRRLVYSQSSEQYGKLFFEIFWTRLLLFGFSCGALLISVWVVAPHLLSLQMAWLPYLLAYVFQQSWFFQGKEDNLAIGVFNIAGRVAGALLLVGLMRHDAPLEAVPLCIGLSYLAPALFSFIYQMRRREFCAQGMQRDDVMRAIAAGRHIFTGNIFVYIFRGTNILLLNWLAADSAVAAYAVAEKIVKCLQAAMRPINQVSFPKIARALKRSSGNSHSNYVLIIGRYLVLQWAFLFVLILLAVILGYVFYSDVAVYFSGNEGIRSLLAVMVIAVFFGVANFIYGSCGLNILGLDRFYARAIASVGVLTLVLASFLIARYAESGAAVAYVAGEFFLFCFLLYKFLTYKASR